MSESPQNLTLADLRAAVEKRGAAFRTRVVLALKDSGWQVRHPNDWLVPVRYCDFQA